MLDFSGKRGRFVSSNGSHAWLWRVLPILATVCVVFNAGCEEAASSGEESQGDARQVVAKKPSASLVGFADYEPQEGDLIFQSLPHGALVDAIEGSTHSPWSHVGMVIRQNDRWMVYEAIGPVRATPYAQFIIRSRGGACAVYRLKDEYQKNIPALIAASKKYAGRPYDMRYRMDDEKIYCSELIYKAYRDVTGEKLGKLVTLGELDWKPYVKTIREIEGADPPLDRKMITPRDLAKAEQLELVTSNGVDLN